MASQCRSPTLAMHDLVLDLTRRGYDLMRALSFIINLDDKIHRPSRQLLMMLHCLAHALCVHYLVRCDRGRILGLEDAKVPHPRNLGISERG